ncbi:DUF6928 family protein [Corynebacterium aquilae]|uniref:DUF6928 family protein n=1 Tax=Corynebacterium aquilae TaxID=203263 RepID=UPI000950CB11|nr:hypothetical protein [Corynebacterium aquilae]
MSLTHVTVWFVTAADPESVIASAGPADRGFGRKYLALLNPRWPITPIGEFTMNRSAAAGKGEFYIGGFPGVTVVHTALEDIERITQLPSWLLSSVPAADTYAIAWRINDGFGAFAHLQGNTLKRALSALPDQVLEDTGLPGTFEAPYWSGEHPNSNARSSITLPFAPAELARAAERAWIGVDLNSTHPPIHVAAFAIDGRKQPKVAPNRPPSIGVMVTAASTKLGLAQDRDYDDYENYDGQPLDELESNLERTKDKIRRSSHNFLTATRNSLHAARNKAATIIGTAPPQRPHKTRPETPLDPEDILAGDLPDTDSPPTDDTPTTH